MSVKKIVLLVVIALIIAGFAFIIGVSVLTIKGINDFGWVTVVYSDKANATVVVADRHAQEMHATGFYIDPSGKVVQLPRVEGQGGVVIVDEWIRELRTDWSIAPRDRGIGLIVVADVIDDQSRLKTVAAAAPINMGELFKGLKPVISILPNYIFYPRFLRGELEDWEIANFSLKQRETVLAAAYIYPAGRLEVEIRASENPGFLGVASVAASDQMSKPIGVVTAWFSKEIRIQASYSENDTNGFAFLVNATVGLLELRRENPEQELRIPIAVPEVVKDGNAWRLVVHYAPFNESYIGPWAPPEPRKPGDELEIETPGRGMHLGPGLGIWFAPRSGLAAFLVGPKVTLRASGWEPHEEAEARIETMEVTLKGKTYSVPYFVFSYTYYPPFTQP